MPFLVFATLVSFFSCIPVKSALKALETSVSKRKPMFFQARPIFHEYAAPTKHANSGGAATRILQGVAK
jgi:hypothetical protein